MQHTARIKTRRKKYRIKDKSKTWNHVAFNHLPELLEPFNFLQYYSRVCVWPASYVVHAADLQAARAGNFLIKYADDTYVIMPACNVESRQQELDHIGEWSKRNNLMLNLSKSAEMSSQTAERYVITATARISSCQILEGATSNRLR